MWWQSCWSGGCCWLWFSASLWAWCLLCFWQLCWAAVTLNHQPLGCFWKPWAEIILSLKENLKALHFWQLSGRDLHQQSKCLGKRRGKMKSLVPYLELEKLVLCKSFRGPSEAKVKGLLWKCGSFLLVWFVTDKNFTGFEQPKPVLGGFHSVMNFLVENQLSLWVQWQPLPKRLHCPKTLLDLLHVWVERETELCKCVGTMSFPCKLGKTHWTHIRKWLASGNWKIH